MSETPLNYRNYLNIVSYLINVAVTYGVGVFGPQNNKDISFKYQTLVTPAGWTFSIWLVINLAQAAFTFMQFQKEHRSSVLVQEGVDYYFVGACAAQIVWIYAFTFEYIGLSLIAMLALLFTLVQIFRKQYTIDSEDETQIDYWVFRFPFEIHLGWIMAASIVNFNVWIEYLNARSTVLVTFAAISLVIIFVLAAGFLWKLNKPNWVIPLVLAWTMIGVAIELHNPKQSIFAAFQDNAIDFVQISAAFIATFILIAIIVRAIKMRIKRRYNEQILELTKSQEAAAAAAKESGGEKKESNADYVMA